MIQHSADYNNEYHLDYGVTRLQPSAAATVLVFSNKEATATSAAISLKSKLDAHGSVVDSFSGKQQHQQGW